MAIKIKTIKIEQAEGRTDRLIRGEFATVDAACAALRSISHQCQPDMLGYLKTDVLVVWEDGTEHGLRADVNQHGDNTNLTAMLRDWAERYRKGVGPTGRNLKHLLNAEQRDACQRILSGELVLDPE